MKIEEVEALEKMVDGKWISSDVPILKALSALRAEAWHPIEKAAELGIGRFGAHVVLMDEDTTWYKGFSSSGRWFSLESGERKYPKWVKEITSPEGA